MYTCVALFEVCPSRFDHFLSPRALTIRNFSISARTSMLPTPSQGANYCATYEKNTKELRTFIRSWATWQQPQAAPSVAPTESQHTPSQSHPLSHSNTATRPTHRQQNHQGGFMAWAFPPPPRVSPLCRVSWWEGITAHLALGHHFPHVRFDDVHVRAHVLLRLRHQLRSPAHPPCVRG
jgi:hypothetical protein